MGASQSTVPATSDKNHNPPEGEQIKPYRFPPGSRYIELDSSYGALYDGIVSLVQDNKYADLVIICGHDRYPVHRAIVCPRSKYFDDHCTPREGEQDFASPAKPTKIWIDPSECESHILAAVLTFLYTLNYSADGHQLVIFGLPQEVCDDSSAEGGAANGSRANGIDDDCWEPDEGEETDTFTTSSSGKVTPPSDNSSRTVRSPTDPVDHKNELVFHVQMCAAGHRFGIESLCDVANAKLAKRLSSPHWETEMIDCIREVYRNGSGGKLGALRDAVVKSARSRFRTLKMREGWHELILEFPEFAATMLQRL